jgi:hypothetical protein
LLPIAGRRYARSKKRRTTSMILAVGFEAAARFERCPEEGVKVVQP